MTINNLASLLQSRGSPESIIDKVSSLLQSDGYPKSIVDKVSSLLQSDGIHHIGEGSVLNVFLPTRM